MKKETARPYQLELFEKAKSANVIAYLDTGAGKTLVSVLLAQLYALNPKKIVFLVPTVPLVSQQAGKLRSNTDLVVGEYSREVVASLSYWDSVGWQHEIANKHILVFTPFIFLSVLRHGFLLLDKHVALLIFDECHHAIGNHTYNLIMSEFYHPLKNSLKTVPKIFGMTASPINQFAKTHDQSLASLNTLERNLDSVVITINDTRDLLGFVARAKEFIIEYADDDQHRAADIPVLGNPGSFDLSLFHDEHVSDCGKYYACFANLVTCTLLKKEREASLFNAADETSKKLTAEIKKLKNALNIIDSAKLDLGYWCAGKIAESFVDAWDLRADYPDFVELECPKIDNITRADLSSKLSSLLRILQNRSSQDPSNFRCMIFVDRRSTAKILSEFINNISPTLFPNIVSNYVTGHGNSASYNQGKGGDNKKLVGLKMNASAQKKFFGMFRDGDVNTMVVTRVAEEGVDVPACKLVIIFDMFRSHTGYVQSRGRARHLTGSEYIVMIRKNDLSTLDSLSKAKMAELVTRNVAQTNSATTVTRGNQDDDIVSYLLAESTTQSNCVTKIGATATQSGALSILLRYYSRWSNCLISRSLLSKQVKHQLITDGMSFYYIQIENINDEWYRDRIVNQTLLATESHSNEEIAIIDNGYTYAIIVPVNFPIKTKITTITPPTRKLDSLKSSQIQFHLIVGQPRLTQKLAIASAALEVVKFLYINQGLNEHLLPMHTPNVPGDEGYRRGKRNMGFTIWNVLKYVKREKGEEEEDGCTGVFERGVSGLFNRDGFDLCLGKYFGKLSEGVLFRLPELNLGIEERLMIGDKVSCRDENSFYVYVVLYGDEIGMYDDDDESLWKLFSKKKKRGGNSFGILTKNPLPSSTSYGITSTIWLDGNVPCKIQCVNWKNSVDENNDGLSSSSMIDEEEDEEEGDEVLESSSSLVTFSDAQVGKILGFQAPFWDIVLSHNIGGDGDQDSSSKSKQMDKRAFCILPFETTNPVSKKSNWKVDWRCVDRVLNKMHSPPTLWKWVDKIFSLSNSSTSKKRARTDDDDSALTSKKVKEGIQDESSKLDIVMFDQPDHHQQLNISSAKKTVIAFDETDHFDRLYQLSQVSPEKLDVKDFSSSDLNIINGILSQTVVYTPHNKLKYTLEKLEPTLGINDKFEVNDKPEKGDIEEASKKMISYGNYIEKLGYQIFNPSSCLVRAKLFNKPLKSMTVKAIPKPISKKKKDHPYTDSSEIFLVPDACYVSPFPKRMIKLAQTIPSILYKLEQRSLVAETKQKFNLPGLTEQTLFQAFCACSAREIVDYERLETLGDSFLKYATTFDLFLRFPEYDEGQLSLLRSKLVSNNHLYKMALKNGYEKLLFVQPFASKFWRPPVFNQGDKVVFKGYFPERKVSKKPLADFVESLIGAFYVDSGHDVAMKFMHSLDLVSKIVVNQFNGDEYRVDVDRLDKIQDLLDAPMNFGGNFGFDGDYFLESMASDLVIRSFPFEKIERVLNYKFQNRAILKEAFTHSSKSSHRNYQRLEFLGDSLIDWVLTRFFFNSYPKCTPAQLSELRQAAVSNECLARFTVKLGFDEFIIYNEATDIKNVIETYLEYLENQVIPLEEEEAKRKFAEDEEEGEVEQVGINQLRKHLDVSTTPNPTTKSAITHIEGPKILGDIFESVAGAIFVDSGYDLHVFWKVYKPILGKFLTLDKMDPAYVTKNPVRLFVEHFQMVGYSDQDIQFIYDEKEKNVIECIINVDNVFISSGMGNSRAIAKKQACIVGLANLV